LGKKINARHSNEGKSLFKNLGFTRKNFLLEQGKQERVNNLETNGSSYPVKALERKHSPLPREEPTKN
jgi:hypothetical protein